MIKVFGNIVVICILLMFPSYSYAFLDSILKKADEALTESVGGSEESKDDEKNDTVLQKQPYEIISDKAYFMEIGGETKFNDAASILKSRFPDAEMTVQRVGGGREPVWGHYLYQEVSYVETYIPEVYSAYGFMIIGNYDKIKGGHGKVTQLTHSQRRDISNLSKSERYAPLFDCDYIGIGLSGHHGLFEKAALFYHPFIEGPAQIEVTSKYDQQAIFSILDNLEETYGKPQRFQYGTRLEIVNYRSGDAYIAVFVRHDIREVNLRYYYLNNIKALEKDLAMLKAEWLSEFPAPATDF